MSEMRDNAEPARNVSIADAFRTKQKHIVIIGAGLPGSLLREPFDAAMPKLF
jgi:hypothetical protein